MHLNKSKAIVQLQQGLILKEDENAVSTYLFFPVCFGHIFYYALRQDFFQNKISVGIFLKMQHLDLLIILLCKCLCSDCHHILIQVFLTTAKQFIKKKKQLFVYCISSYWFYPSQIKRKML